MKVKHSIGVSQWSGKAGNDVFMPSTKEGMSYRRVMVTPTITPQNTLSGTIMKNLASVWTEIDAGYKADLQEYGVQYKALPIYGSDWKERTSSEFAIFVKLMYTFSELDSGHIDLATITLTDLGTVATAISTVNSAITNGYLPVVPNPQTWSNTMQGA